MSTTELLSILNQLIFVLKMGIAGTWFLMVVAIYYLHALSKKN
jgi:hypothetical protein